MPRQLKPRTFLILYFVANMRVHLQMLAIMTAKTAKTFCIFQLGGLFDFEAQTGQLFDAEA